MNEQKNNSLSAVEKTVPITKYAAKFGEVTKNVLFGDIWERPDLSKRDRSLITVAALVAMYRFIPVGTAPRRLSPLHKRCTQPNTRNDL